MMSVELVILPRLALGLRGAGSQFFDLLIERRTKSASLERGWSFGARNTGSGAAPRRRRAVRDSHVREFNQTGELREGILGARLLGASGAQAPLKFVEVDLVAGAWPGNAHKVLTCRWSS